MWVTDAVAWSAIALFLAAWALEARARHLARVVGAVGSIVFAALWLLLIPHYAFEVNAPIEAVLAAFAVPGSLYAGYHLYAGRNSVLTLTRAVAIMGLLYLPFETVPALRRGLVEAVAYQTYVTIQAVGYDPTLTVAPENGYLSSITFLTGGHQYRTFIVLGCTGLGSITIFTGLIAALDAPMGQKLRAIGLAAAVIYVLNIVRNVFIAVAFGDQWFRLLEGPIMTVAGYTDPGLVSFFIADRVIAQSLSVVALVGITYVVVRTVPELLSLLEEALFLVTRTEYDLHAAFAVDARR